MDMLNKVVLITGASRGIGAATARAFADVGAKVALVARSTSEIEALAAEIGENAIAVPCDVSVYDDVVAAISKTVDAFGPLDVFIGNAGLLDPITHLADADPDAWGKTIDVNLKGVFNGMRAAMPDMNIKASGINPVSQLAWSDHIPPEWPARTLVWMCSADADAYLGDDISLRDDDIRKKVGLI